MSSARARRSRAAARDCGRRVGRSAARAAAACADVDAVMCLRTRRKQRRSSCATSATAAPIACDLRVRHAREQRQRADRAGQALGHGQAAGADGRGPRRPRCGGSASGSGPPLAMPRAREVRAQRVALGACGRRTGGRRGRRAGDRRRAAASTPGAGSALRAASAAARRRWSFQPSRRRSLTPQHRRLQGVEPRRGADDAVVVARALAVRAQQPHALGELGVVGHDRAAVAPGAEVLGRVEAEAAGVAERADAACRGSGRRAPGRRPR